ncbi:MAG: hypothetical protein K2M97_04845, partial [Muribaculaceae bacterium]|nr:hypothetical protein [Muribaculaceae bacterium]
MEDDELKRIFSDFEPDMSPDFQFVSKLEQRLEAVEIVREQVAEVRSRSRKAVVIAAVVGFVVGFLSSLSLPYLSAAVARWQLTLPDASAI